MPDDPDAFAQFEVATSALHCAMGRVKGLKSWGDNHHPSFHSGMLRSDIDALDHRPANLTVEQLTDAERDYFFSHASCNVLKASEHLNYAIRYFLPCYAKLVLHNAKEQQLLGCLQNFGTSIGRSHWWEDENWASAIETWLVAWLNAADKFARPMPDVTLGSIYTSRSDNSRDFSEVLYTVILAGVSEKTLETVATKWSLQSWIELIGKVIIRTKTTTKCRLPDCRYGSEVLKQRVQNAGEVLHEFFFSKNLLKMLEDAVMNEYCAAHASEALSHLEALARSHA